MSLKGFEDQRKEEHAKINGKIWVRVIGLNCMLCWSWEVLWLVRGKGKKGREISSFGCKDERNLVRGKGAHCFLLVIWFVGIDSYPLKRRKGTTWQTREGQVYSIRDVHVFQGSEKKKETSILIACVSVYYIATSYGLDSLYCIYLLFISFPLHCYSIFYFIIALSSPLSLIYLTWNVPQFCPRIITY